MNLPTIEATGLLCIPDPHIAATPPMQRLESYMDDVLQKLAACLDHAVREKLVPVILGDLFHWPRENPNTLIVALIELFRPHHPFVLVGNHDKYQARFTPDTSLAVLRAADVVTVLDAPGLFLRLVTPTGPAVVGASPDGSPLPAAVEKEAGETSVWLTHHGIGFPDAEDRHVRIHEIAGLDWVINGHLHRPHPTVVSGATRWANPGNITRLKFTRKAMTRVPAASVWRPGADDLEHWPVPYRPFAEVFPDQEFPPEEAASPEYKSRFLEGLSRLAWRRTREGAGLGEFLRANLNPESPETEVIWELYREVTHAGK
ncbi:metallophosphoesterase [Desulfovibrio sp. JY]|nr:metallophosphoesterase [Desulfovibrio sp. JY]